MPYVKQHRRTELLRGSIPENAGDLAFLLTAVINRFLRHHPEQFERYAQAMAGLEATKLELYRRHIGPYENEKLEENGDVYGEISLLLNGIEP